MSLLQLSTRQPDLLDNSEESALTQNFVQVPNATTKELEAPRNIASAIPHELMSENSRLRTKIADYVNAQRMLSGNAHAEQLLMELNSASHINRGPDGVFESSRLHWDLLLGRDENIYPSDYLNFDSKMKF